MRGAYQRLGRPLLSLLLAVSVLFTGAPHALLHWDNLHGHRGVPGGESAQAGGDVPATDGVASAERGAHCKRAPLPRERAGGCELCALTGTRPDPGLPRLGAIRLVGRAVLPSVTTERPAQPRDTHAPRGPPTRSIA